jgi:hypothetical protein
MSWMARKIAGTDNEDNQQAIQEYLQMRELYFAQEAKVSQADEKELKRLFWEEYEERGG